ncbi:MAG: bifunctional demethylmenaquinone methyltransferase/2-methoxy-6-polyprenyl-1,4-benzoquinol methylase UbiE [Bacteriovoracaceae bacterium]|nr:bifunctional demethylmenaquinone methyltransferase/2-methoxy-6-polyprenyl-1,4-benzoquinol methylase UbiE [Bacteriovoracaceae bacterium]
MEITNKEESWKGFNLIANTYDQINRLTSLGIDGSWRKKLACYLPHKEHLDILDLATGTAEVAIELSNIYKHRAKITGVDPAAHMVEIGQNKIKEQGLDKQISLQVGNAMNLDFDDNSFDAVTIAFGIRNVPNIDTALKEIFRVLRPGGRVVILEFSLPKNIFVKSGYLLYFRHILPTIGRIISGHKNAYSYLNKSVEDFPYGDAFLTHLGKAGLIRVKDTPLSLGIASIYTGDKI